MTRPPGYFETAPILTYLAASVVAGLLMCWPLILNGGPLLFFDSGAYLSGGQKILNYIIGIFGTAGGTEGSGAVPDVEKVGQSIRSIFYAFYVYLTSRTAIEYSGPVLIQSIFVAGLVLLLLPARAVASRWVIGGAVLLLLTPLPFYASLLMPDLLAAAVILSGLILARAQTARAVFMAFLALTVSIASHYGNLPLALALIAAVGFWLLVRRRLTLWRMAAMVLPFLIATGINVAGSAVAFDKPSAAPRRLPILLARSLEDGPARWHLAEHCDTYDYAICSAVEEIPSNVGAALWDKGGLGDIKSAGLMEEIRAQERIILQRAFLEYPVQQTWSLARNFAIQLVRFGLSDVYLGEVVSLAGEEAELDLDRDTARAAFDSLEILHIAIVAVSLVYLARLMLARQGHLSRNDRFTILFLFLGLLVNAAIFGGLSAPVDRYQGRIIWLVPLLALIFWAGRDDRA